MEEILNLLFITGLIIIILSYVVWKSYKTFRARKLLKKKLLHHIGRLKKAPLEIEAIEFVNGEWRYFIKYYKQLGMAFDKTGWVDENAITECIRNGTPPFNLLF